MRWVEAPAHRPSRCAVIPWLSTSRYGFVDTGMQLPGWDPHVYVSGEAVVEMMNLLGFNRPAGGTRELEKAKARIAELEAELEANKHLMEAVEYSLGAFGQKVRSKPGPKQKAVA